MLRSYIYYVKDAFQPTLTPEAEQVIVNYYQLQRRSNAGNRNQARTTIRMLESLVRLAQGKPKPSLTGSPHFSTRLVLVTKVTSGKVDDYPQLQRRSNVRSCNQARAITRMLGRLVRLARGVPNLLCT
jgi:hypothetical protein